MDERTVTYGIIGGAVIAYLLYRKFSRSSSGPPAGTVASGKVAKLLIYPVKSLPHMPEIGRVKCDNRGLITEDNEDIRDRAWMIVNDRGVFLSQRAEPSLALLRPCAPYGGDHLHIDAPRSETLKVNRYLTSKTAEVVTVSVWGQKMNAVDCGEKAAQWICNYLGKPGYKLVFLPESLKGRPAVHSPCNIPTKTFTENDQLTFVDAAPVFLISENSVKDINSQVEGAEVTTRNFRPNIVITGIPAFEEDTWDEVYIGTAKLTNVRRCDRCTLPNVNPDNGEKNPNNEPLASLKRIRPLSSAKDPFLGIYMDVIREGTIKLGDTVYVTKKNKGDNK